MPETIVRCDGCGAHGRRAENAAAPDFWFYLESVDRTFHNQDGIYVVWACSEACRDGMWKRGPSRGQIDDAGTFRKRSAIAKKCSACHSVPAMANPRDCAACGGTGNA